MTTEQQSASRPRRTLVILPLLLFVALGTVFFFQLISGRDIAAVPSALIGQKAPDTSLPPLEGMNLPGLESSTFVGKVTLVNVFASWCGPCRQEHPYLLELSRDQRFVIVGLNYKDQAENARRFLGELGNPYRAVGVDDRGRAAINWGVYGVPETFLIGKNGTIIYKQVGPLSDASYRILKSEIDKALAAQ